MPNASQIGCVTGTREIVVAGTNSRVVYRILNGMIQVPAVLHGTQE
jgi:hypothetical protein